MLTPTLLVVKLLLKLRRNWYDIILIVHNYLFNFILVVLDHVDSLDNLVLLETKGPQSGLPVTI